MSMKTSNNDSVKVRPSTWFDRTAFSWVSLLFYGTQLALGYCVYHGYYWLVLPLVLTSGHLIHGLLIGFHEASHGILRKNRRFNEAEGLLIGTLSFMSFTLYRVVHQTHHMHFATERDQELWPFVDPKVPRAARVLSAFLELFCGLFFTPFIFFRCFFCRDSPIRASRVRRRIYWEIALILLTWTAILSAIAFTGTWKYFFWMYFLPGFIAGNLQSWRKYIEHIGLTASTVRGATRSIVNDSLPSRLVAFSLLHEPFHGVHHLNAGLKHAELPSQAHCLLPVEADDRPPFRSYRHALMDLFRSLPDPKVGAQWRKPVSAGSREEAEQAPAATSL